MLLSSLTNIPDLTTDTSFAIQDLSSSTHIPSLLLSRHDLDHEKQDPSSPLLSEGNSFKENIKELSDLLKCWVNGNYNFDGNLPFTHLSQTLTFQKEYGLLCWKNNTEEIKDEQVTVISRQKLIERVIDEKIEDSDFNRTVLYTYNWYFTEIELFTLLLNRFMVPIPLCISTPEKKAFLEIIVSKIQIKVLIFLKDWFKLHNTILQKDQQVQRAFLELLALMIRHKNSGKWINLPLSQLINACENLNTKEKVKREPRRSTVKLTCLSEIFISIPVILDHAHFIAKQLCLFDSDNLQRVQATEFYKKAWTKPDRHHLAPNLAYIAEMSTKLSRFTSYLILMNKKDSVRIMMYEYILGLCDKLIRLKNYNSAFSIYLGIASQAVQRLKELIEPRLGKEYKEMLKCLRKFFSSSNNMQHLRARQSEAQCPAIPYMGIYLGDMFFIEELSDFMDKGQSTINFKKSRMMCGKITKALSYKGSYGFHKVDRVYNFIKNLPMISEEKIYQLSYQIR